MEQLSPWAVQRLEEKMYADLCGDPDWISTMQDAVGQAIRTKEEQEQQRINKEHFMASGSKDDDDDDDDDDGNKNRKEEEEEEEEENKNENKDKEKENNNNKKKKASSSSSAPPRTPPLATSGVVTITLDELAGHMTEVGKASVPPQIKEKMLQRIRNALEKQVPQRAKQQQQEEQEQV